MIGYRSDHPIYFNSSSSSSINICQRYYASQNSVVSK